MKRITLLIAAIVITASCQNAIITPDRTIPDQTAVPEGTTIITAGFDDLSGASTADASTNATSAAAANNSGAPATRTSIDGSTGKVSWSAHEQILVFPNRYGQQVTEGQLFTSLNDAPQATAKFEGVLPTADFEFDTYGAIYPPQADAFANGDGIAATLPAHQTGIPDTFPDGLNFAFAFTQDPKHMLFQHPLSGLRFSVQSSGITRVLFRSNEKYGINGLFQVDPDSDGKACSTGYSIYDGNEGLEFTVTDLVPLSGTFEPGKSYYIILIPLPMDGGFTLLFERSDGKYAYRNINQDVDFPRATFRTLMDADAGLEWVDGTPHLSQQTVSLTEEASYFTIEAQCPSGSYTVESDCDWLREVAAEGDVISYGDAYNLNMGGDAQFGGYTHAFLCKANTGAARTGHILFRKDGVDYPVTVMQEAGTLPTIKRHHVGFTMLSHDTNTSDWWKRDLLWDTAKLVPEGTLNIAEGFSGQKGSDAFKAGKWLAWLYRNWGAIDGRATLSGNKSNTSTDNILAWMQESDDYYPPLTSIAVTASAADPESRLITATVKVYAAKAGTYSLTGAIIEESASYGNGGLSTKSSHNLIVAMLTAYTGSSVTIDSDGGTATLELSVTAPDEVHSAQSGNWGDLGEMSILLFTRTAYGTKAKVNVTAPLNDSSLYIDNSRLVAIGSTCELEVTE